MQEHPPSQVEGGIRPFQDRPRRPLNGAGLTPQQLKAIREINGQGIKDAFDHLTAIVAQVEKAMRETINFVRNFAPSDWDGPVPSYVPSYFPASVREEPEMPPVAPPAVSPAPPDPVLVPVPPDDDVVTEPPDDDVVMEPREKPASATPAMAMMLDENPGHWEALAEIIRRDAPPQARLAAMRKHLTGGGTE